MGDAALAIDVDLYAFVADKGPCTAIALEDESQDSMTFDTLRIFGLKKGHAVQSGVCGHYLVNTHGQAEGDEFARAFSLPALLHPLDEGSPAVYGLAWKVATNGQIYAKCVPTQLKLPSDVDAPDKWVGDADVTTRRLGLFKRIEPIENRDGHPMAKQFDAWLKDHCNYFRELKMRSLAATRAWLSHGKFETQFAAVQETAKSVIRTGVYAACGEEVAEQANKKRKPNSAAPKSPSPAAKTEISRRLELLSQVTTPFALAVKKCSQPVGNRIIELDLEPQEEYQPMPEEDLMNLIKSKAPAVADELVEVLKTGDTLKELTQKATCITLAASPLPPAPAPEATAEEAPENSDDDDPEFPSLGELCRRRSTRPKNRPEFASPSAESRAKRKEAIQKTQKQAEPKAAAPASRSSTSGHITIDSSDFGSDFEGKGKAKRSYTKTGLYSKDPARAAAARATHRSTKDLAPAPAPGITPLVLHFNIEFNLNPPFSLQTLLRRIWTTRRPR
jgi:hypothetical protein